MPTGNGNACSATPYSTDIYRVSESAPKALHQGTCAPIPPRRANDGRCNLRWRWLRCGGGRRSSLMRDLASLGASSPALQNAVGGLGPCSILLLALRLSFPLGGFSRECFAP